MEEFRIHAFRALESGNWTKASSYALAAIYSQVGLDWPYYILGYTQWRQGRQGSARSFFRMFQCKETGQYPELSEQIKGLIDG